MCDYFHPFLVFFFEYTLTQRVLGEPELVVFERD